MRGTSILTFWAVALLLIVIPGPDWAFTLGSTLRGQPVLAAVAGLVVGYAMLTAVVSVGVGAAVAGTPAALAVLTVAGGGYLTWQGVAVLRHPSALAVGRSAASSRGTVIRGVGVSGLNPKALLLFLALLPQFTQPAGAWPVTAQLAVLGSVFTATCGAFYALLGSFARTVLQGHPSAGRSLSRLSGAAMIVIGMLLVTERLAGGRHL